MARGHARPTPTVGRSAVLVGILVLSCCGAAAAPPVNCTAALSLAHSRGLGSDALSSATGSATVPTLPELCTSRVNDALDLEFSAAMEEPGLSAWGADGRMPRVSWSGEQWAQRDVNDAVLVVVGPNHDRSLATADGGAQDAGSGAEGLTEAGVVSWAACELYGASSPSQAAVGHCVLRGVQFRVVDGVGGGWALLDRDGPLSDAVASALLEPGPARTGAAGVSSLPRVIGGAALRSSEVCAERGWVRGTTHILHSTGNLFHALHDVVFAVFETAMRRRIRGADGDDQSGVGEGLVLFDLGEPSDEALAATRSWLLRAALPGADVRGWPEGSFRGLCFEEVVVGQPLSGSLYFPPTRESQLMWRKFSAQLRRARVQARLEKQRDPALGGAAVNDEAAYEQAPIAPHVTFIARQDRQKRYLTNLDALVGVCERKGISTSVLVPEESGIEDVAAALANTTLLVGATGAGLSNAVLLPPGAGLVVFWPGVPTEVVRHPYFDAWEQMVRANGGETVVVVGDGDFAQFSVDVIDFAYTLDVALRRGIHAAMPEAWVKEPEDGVCRARSGGERASAARSSTWQRCRAAGGKWEPSATASPVEAALPWLVLAVVVVSLVKCQPQGRHRKKEA